MAIALYNPRYFKRGNEKIENTADIKGFVWSHARWGLKVNELKKFPDDVGEAILKRCEFVIRVDKSNLAEIEEMRKLKEFQCKHCDFETNTRIAFINHVKTHKNVEEKDEGFLGEIESSKPVGEYAGVAGKKIDPEALEGIPKGGTKRDSIPDKDNVGWYGEGKAKDNI
jgi:hypothetical protein